MPFYEHVFIARQDAAQTQVDQITEQMKGIIEQGGGKVVKVEQWGLRSLAYKIKKNRKGHYVHLAIDGPWAPVGEVERQPPPDALGGPGDENGLSHVAGLGSRMT